MIAGLFWVATGRADTRSKFFFTFIIGNCTTIAVGLTLPLLSRQRTPFDWLGYLAILLPVSGLARALALIANRLAFQRTGNLLRFDWQAIEPGMIFRSR